MLASVDLGIPVHPAESGVVSKLSDRLAQAKHELGLSTRQIQERAERGGYKLSSYSATVYTNGKHPAKPDLATLEALAYALKVPEAELMELAGLPDRRTFSPHEDADLLTTAQQNAVNEIIRLLAEGNRNDSSSFDSQEAGTPSEADESQKTPAPPLDRLGVDLAALKGERALDADDAAASRRGEEPQD